MDHSETLNGRCFSWEGRESKWRDRDGEEFEQLCRMCAHLTDRAAQKKATLVTDCLDRKSGHVTLKSVIPSGFLFFGGGELQTNFPLSSFTSCSARFYLFNRHETRVACSLREPHQQICGSTGTSNETVRLLGLFAAWCKLCPFLILMCV